MLRLTAERGSPAKDPRASTDPDTGRRQDGIAHYATDDGICPVSNGARASDYPVAFLALAAFLALIAATGLLVELLAGIGALALLAGAFVVVLMVLAREEGLL